MKQMSEDEWRDVLTPEQFNVLRKKGTEPAFSGSLLYNDEVGAYVCAGCGAVLFHSQHKFDSGSGWPSFYDVANPDTVALKEDRSHGMHRIEVACKQCGGHLGHVFNDAPDQPTGMRFCVNSDALAFKPEDLA